VITQYSNAVIHIINYSSYTELLFTAQYFKYCYNSQFDTPAYNFTILCTTAGKKKIHNGMHVTKIKSPTWLKRNIHIKGVEIMLPRGSKKNLDIKGIYIPRIRMIGTASCTTSSSPLIDTGGTA
jgi:hypothetical protein